MFLNISASLGIVLKLLYVILTYALSLKKIGELARRELENILGHKVHLFLFVKVKENWSDKPDHYVDWGLDFNA